MLNETCDTLQHLKNTYVTHGDTYSRFLLLIYPTEKHIVTDL